MRCLVLFLVLAISACAPKKPVNPSVLGRYNFAYELTRQRATGVIQVFDDGKSTYFQFIPGGREKIETISRGGAALKTETFGRSYLSVSGTSERFVIKAAAKSTVVNKIGEGVL